MEDIARALRDFFSGFGLAAYPEDAVPEASDDGDSLTGMLPYITYALAKPDFAQTAPIAARVFDWSDGYALVTRKADEIVLAVGTGILLPAGAGYICLRPADGAVVTLEPAQDHRLKTACVSLMISAYTD